MTGSRDTISADPAWAAESEPGPRIERMYAQELLAGLNEEQLAVARFDGGPLRVLAGAGTGKTTAITGRVARLVADGTPAERVLLLTFTRRAARQMMDRSHARLARAGHRPGRISGGTFHSVAHRTLRQHAAPLGLPEGFSVLDPADAADVIDLVRDEILLGRTAVRRFPRKATLLDLYSRAVDTARRSATSSRRSRRGASTTSTPSARCARPTSPASAAWACSTSTTCCCTGAGAARRPRRQIAGGTVDHVLVDEYQDVNALQVELLRCCARTTTGSRSSATTRRPSTPSAAPTPGTSWPSTRTSPARRRRT